MKEKKVCFYDENSVEAKKLRDRILEALRSKKVYGDEDSFWFCDGEDEVYCSLQCLKFYNVGVYTDGEVTIRAEVYLECEENLMCEDCEGCTGCLFCRKCKDCKDCKDCNGCIVCKDCKNCNFCSWCTRCFWCKDCNGCKECEDCKNCKDCTHCNTCWECTQARYEEYVA